MIIFRFSNIWIWSYLNIIWFCFRTVFVILLHRPTTEKLTLIRLVPFGRPVWESQEVSFHFICWEFHSVCVCVCVCVCVHTQRFDVDLQSELKLTKLSLYIYKAKLVHLQSKLKHKHAITSLRFQAWPTKKAINSHLFLFLFSSSAVISFWVANSCRTWGSAKWCVNTMRCEWRGGEKVNPFIYRFWTRLNQKIWESWHETSNIFADSFFCADSQLAPFCGFPFARAGQLVACFFDMSKSDTAVF